MEIAPIDQTWDQWYLVGGVKVNPADMDAMRKIAAVAVRCMETYGPLRRKV